MSSDPTWDRREFTRASVLALLSGVVITVSGCSEDNPTAPPQNGGSNNEEGIVSANHGHRAVITEVQLSAGNEVSLNIQGTATHGHTVALTGAQIQAIARGERVSQASTTDDSHSHTVTFN